MVDLGIALLRRDGGYIKAARLYQLRVDLRVVNGVVVDQYGDGVVGMHAVDPRHIGPGLDLLDQRTVVDLQGSERAAGLFRGSIPS
jgi:hypothetical protein